MTRTWAKWGARPIALLLLAATVAAGLTLVGGAAAASPSANLDQCANGSFGSPTSCPPSWQNGDLNHSNSFYREGDTVPFRAVLTSLDPGNHSLVIQYDTTKSGKHAYDYLTRFDRTVTGADPCDGGTLCSGAASTFGPIPLSNNPAPPAIHIVADANRSFSIWGGTITSVALGGDPSDVAGEQQSMTIDFSATNDSVVIAWGGHVADEITWGAGTGAGAIPGSPYHMRIISLDGSGGNQDHAMQSNAVAPVVPSFTTDAVGSEDGATFTDHALLTGSEANGPVSGTISFFVCHAADGTPDCSSGGDLVSADVAVGGLGTAESAAYAPAHGPGTYCFRGEYTPDADAQYSATAETNSLVNHGDGNHGECFTVESPPTTQLTLDKVVVNDNGGGAGASDFTLSATAGEQVLSGHGPEAGPFDVTPDRGYALGETGPSGYTASSWSCTGGSLDGHTITLQAGDHVTCTITNDDNAPVVTTTTTTTTPPPPPPPPPPAPSIDLAITKSVSPASVTLGGTATWTETVTNNGPDTATGVKVGDALPAGLTFVSAQATQGTCSGTAVVTCTIGSLAKGASATVTIVSTATTAGSIVNTATVVGNEAETNAANNTASAALQVNVFVPPVVNPKPKPPLACTAIVAAPRTIYVGRKALLTLRITQKGKAVHGIRVRIAGTPLTLVTGPSNAKGVVKVRLTPKRPGLVRFAPVAHKQCKVSRIGVVGVFSPPVTG